MLYDGQYDIASLCDYPEVYDSIFSRGLIIVGWRKATGGEPDGLVLRGTREAHIKWVTEWYETDDSGNGIDFYVENLMPVAVTA
jgi:hypothetical protein